MQFLRKAIDSANCLLDIEAHDMRTVLALGLDHLVGQGHINPEQRDVVLNALLEREVKGSTAIGQSVAVPHAYLPVLSEPIIMFLRLERPLNLGAPDGIPTRFVIILLGPEGRSIEHLDTLMHIARLMSDAEFRTDARYAESPEDLLTALDRFVARTAPPALPPEHIPEPLAFTGRFAGGLLGDVRRRLACYAGDFRDGLHPKCLSSTIFLYFACLAPAITFGGIMSAKTGGQIGVVEMMIATTVCGIAYALLAGQPLIILGGTGPLLIFTAVLYQMCMDMEIPFLPTYAWVGIWTALLVIILSVTDASFLMRYFTRFTDEIFAGLISIIFIYEAVRAIVEVFQRVYSETKTSHDTAFLTLLLALGTFYIASSLSQFRKSRYLIPRWRQFLTDFGPSIAIIVMTLVAVFLSTVDLQRLTVPEQLDGAGKSWLVNPLDAPMWVRWAAILPALLAAVLVYLDQNITARLINNPANKLAKGAGYHLDLLVVGVGVGACSVFGLPWLVAATVRSLNHMRSLATVDEAIGRDGSTRERVIHVRENRVTGLGIHILIGLSLLLLPLIKMIPLAVLYGLFLYMGVVSMAGNHFFERLALWPMDPNLYPSTHYMRKVPTRTIHKYTFVQLACLVVLWLVKASRVGILFPLFIALLVPVRLLLTRYIEPRHLDVLDAEEEPEDDETLMLV